MTIASKGFGEQVLTMQSASAIGTGTPVKLTDNYTVSAAAANDAFCGVVLSCREGLCAVQLRGSVTLPYSGTAPSVGASVLASDGEGGVTSAESGTAVLILAVDSTASTVTILL